MLMEVIRILRNVKKINSNKNLFFYNNIYNDKFE